MSFFSSFFSNSPPSNKQSPNPLPPPPTPPPTKSPFELLNFVFATFSPLLKPGIQTQHLSDYIESLLKPTDAVLYFRGYRGYPAIVSTSVNDEVLHTLPSSRTLQDGDILKVEFGLCLANQHAFQGWTFPIGRISPEDEALMAATKRALSNAVSEAKVQGHVGHISGQIQQTE